MYDQISEHLIREEDKNKKLFGYHHHKHQGLDSLIRSVSRVTAARANASSVFQLFSFPLVCSGMISKGFGFVAFLASVKASSVCIHLSCLVCLQSVLYAYTYFQFWRFRFFSNYFKNSVTYEKSVFYISCIVDLLLQLFC